MRIFKRINTYIAAHFLVKFLQIVFAFSLLIFFVNLIDVIEKVRGQNVPFSAMALMAFLKVPDFLNDVVPSLVLISAIITFFLLSSRSEITITRASGFSIWQVLQPIAFCAFFLGIFWVTVFGPASVHMAKKFNSLEGKYVKNDMREVIELEGGIWLKQNNIEYPNEEIIIQAKKVYKESLELDEVTAWFFNQNNQFYQKIDAEEMFLDDGYWLMQNVTVNNFDTLNKKLPSFSVPTDLKADFVMQKIVNNFQNVKLFSVFELPYLIADLRSAGFSSTKFKVYLQSLLCKPILFLAMIFIACYFGLNHTRSRTSILMIFLGISFGLILYITSTIITALGSSSLIPIFASTWVIAVICLAIGVLLIYRKEKF